ncbi:hypothetical protein MES4922_10163 [Mesorhizobium ventifaucium]|uniref:Uncharacterized protein n=1 Tax=Mesorhizobium ventifaucium TaxID=666020 RepID=A0ABN8J930_9HYPH|nr:hypothetical protein MES4922_10163 [Mesorhizobium ventifaucium]
MVEPTAFLSLTGRGGAPPFPRFSHRGAPVKRCCHLSRKRCAKWKPAPNYAYSAARSRSFSEACAGFRTGCLHSWRNSAPKAPAMVRV